MGVKNEWNSSQYFAVLLINKEKQPKMTMEVKYNFFFFQNWWSPHEHLGPWNTGVLQNEIIFLFFHSLHCRFFLCAAWRGTCCLLKLETDNVTKGRRLFIYDYLQETQRRRKMFQLQVSWVLLQRTKVFTWTVATILWWEYHFIHFQFS